MVFPTQVGMIPTAIIADFIQSCFPHTSGDDPLCSIWVVKSSGFSPHKWGWSAFHLLLYFSLQVFPTQVGMIHRYGNRHENRGRFSPHKWGWSLDWLFSCFESFVFPTQVGMIPDSISKWLLFCCFPHTSGDDPEAAWRGSVRRWFSPHKWGWSWIKCTIYLLKMVFPTQVGMIRFQSANWKPISSFPHTSGDDPYSAFYEVIHAAFSPHKWGWSCRFDFRRLWRAVFPTQVGMIPE